MLDLVLAAPGWNSPYHRVLEDAPKFIAIPLWSAYLVLVTRRATADAPFGGFQDERADHGASSAWDHETEPVATTTR